MSPLGLLIPAYKPTASLRKLVETLQHRGFFKIIVVNDGSPKQFRSFFLYLQNKKKVTVLFHDVNRGKGAALKTGFKFFCTHHPKSAGLVTADADGQHLSSDILKVAAALRKNPQCVVLGSRRLDGKVPLRSRVGNHLARMTFKVLLNIDMTDTQTGLRGLPTKLLDGLLQLPSGHYAFETDSLIVALRKKYKIIEEPISAVYIENNKSSHFGPIIDSMRICCVFIRFIGSFLFWRSNRREKVAMGFREIVSKAD